MKKFLVVTALLSLLCPFAVTAATTSGSSGNCTVDTCDFVLKATSEPEGIRLSWRPYYDEFTSTEYKLERGNITFQPFKPELLRLDDGVTWGGILDRNVKYGEEYTYKLTVIIETSGIAQKKTATAKCVYEGNGNAPKIEAIEAAELWLENECYNTMITFNDYDTSVYKIEKLCVSVNGGKAVGIPFHNVNSATGYLNIDLYKYGLKKGVKHGTNEIVVWLEYEDIKAKKKGIETDKKDKNAKCVAKCFFHKYGGSSHPNWFEYWSDDGAIPKSPTFKFKKEAGSTLGLCSNVVHFSTCDVSNDGKFKTLDGDLRTFPTIKKHTGINSYLYLYPDAAAKSSSINLKNGETIGKDGYGVNACYIVRRHEEKHRETAQELNNAQKGHYSKVSISDLDLAALRQSVQNDAQAKYYYEELCKTLADVTVESFDKDGDGVLDTKEKGYDSRMDKTKADTFRISELNWDDKTKKTYKERGDNEYISRREEEKSEIPEDLKNKDWAFPGTHIANGANTKGVKYEGMTKTEWASEKVGLQKKLSTSFPSLKTGKSELRSQLALMATLSPDDNSETVSERVDVLPDFSFDNLTRDVEIVNVKSGTVKGDKGGYSQLSFEVQIATKENVTNDVVLTGWLVDSYGNPVARSQRYIESLNGSKTVEMEFFSSDLYVKGGQGYSLKYLTLASVVVNGEQDIFDARVEAASTDRQYDATEFAPSSAYFASLDEVHEVKAQDLSVTIPIEICSNGVYDISASLRTEDGERVADAFVTNITQLGKQEFCIVFSGKDIFLSKQNGPYVVRKIELRREDGECVDSEWDAYTTAAYSYRDFADGSETIFADAGSFRREADLVGVDGLCDALNFSFAVTNLAPSEAEYVARIYLCGTNDELVCSSMKNVVLSNEINMVNVPFRGIDVKKRDVEGPYYVNEVAIEDAESGEVVERFKPAQILVDRMLSEFGDSPVALNGEATLAEGTGAGTFVVNVPVSAVRPGVVRASAVLVATNGTPVVSAEASREFSAGENGVFTLSFNAADINATGVRGPYEVKYLCLSTDYEGTDEVHLDDLGLGELESEFILYVDASKVDDSGDGFTPATAKATIQGAIKVAQPFDTILVADGIYEPIWCGAPGVTIRSMNGPANAIIDGEGQARCVELWAEGTEYYDEEDDEWYYVEPIGGKPVIEGFTLRNGWARGAGAGIYDGTARNCIITGCRSVSDGGGALDATLENCVICGNSADGAGGGASHCELYGCTVSANKAANGAGGVAHSKVYNSIVHGNTGANEETSEHDYYDGEGGDSTFDYSCTFPLPPSGEGNIAADPLLVDPIHGDVRLRSASPCIDAASPDIDHCDLDIYGHPRVQGEAPEMGAVEGCFEDRICVSASVRGIGTVTPQSAFVEAGGSVTFTASSDVREFLAFEVDGKRVSASPVFTLDGIKEDMSITAVFKTGTYYVKADGSDENSGLDWDHAKATIQGALDVCEDGETIYVESGVYGPFDSDDRPVTIRSMLGAAETVIDAGGIGCCAFMGGGLRETNTVLIGFTLQNGVVGGAGGGARGGTLVDCRIINNRAGESGGGLYYSVASRCIISNNMVVADGSRFASYAYDDYGGESFGCYGGGCSSTVLYNCLVNNNVVDARAVIGCRGAGGGTYNGSLYNCTVTGNSVLTASSDEEDGDDDDDEYGSVPYARGGGSAFDGAYNTIIWGNTVNGLTENVYDVFTNDCLEDGVDPMFVEGGFALSQGSPCIDAGNEVHVSGGMDVMGNKRVVGDGVDIGAYEYSADVETMFYEVVFMPNGGEGNMESLTCAFGERQSLPTNEFVLAGHVFMGWSLSDVGEVVYRDGEEIFNLASHAGGRVELYANWSQNGNSGPGTIFLTAEVVNGGGLMKVRVQRVGGNEGRVAVKLKTQDASTVGGINGRSGVDFDYFKEFLVWNDGDMSDRVVYIQTHATDATSATTFRLKLSVLTTGDYADCVTPTLASGGKVIATITPAKKGTIAIVEPDPLEVVAGEYLRVKVRRTGGSDGRVAVKLKTQDSATVGGINGVSGRDFQYVKEYLVWEDGDASDRLVEIPTVAAWWSGEPKTFRLKLSVQTSGAFAGCGTPALASNGKVIASIYPNEEAYPGAVGVTKVETVNCCAIRMDGPVVEPPWWGYAGDTLRVTVSRVGGSFGRVAVKAKTQDSATVGGINGVSGRDFQYVKEYLVWEDGEDGDKTMEIPTAIVDGVDYPRTFRLKLSALTTGDYEGCETPELPEPKVVIGLME